jgi:hypothetical protein
VDKQRGLPWLLRFKQPIPSELVDELEKKPLALTITFV